MKKTQKNESQSLKEHNDALAKAQTNPIISTTEMIVNSTTTLFSLDRNAVFDELNIQAKNIQEGNLERAETMLIMQAQALDVLFAEMVTHSRKNIDLYPNATEKYMRLALKAQSQCRSTLEALSGMKNPKPYIQNNRAQYQQINNEPSHAHEKLNQRNELLEKRNNEQQWVDTTAPKATIKVDKTLETVEK